MVVITAVNMNQGPSLLSFPRPHHISISVGADTHVAWCPGPPAALWFASAEASTEALKEKKKKLRTTTTKKGNLIGGIQK